MHSPCELILYAPFHKAKQAAKEVLVATKQLERTYNFYNPNSLISAINQRKESKLTPELASILEQAYLYYQRTDGIFDITVGTLKRCLNASSYAEYQACIEKMQEFLGWQHITLTKNRIHFDNPYTMIDLGGFVKEYAVDKAKRILKRHKINGIINFGGDIAAVGSKPDGSAFRIGIKDPYKPNQFATFVEISDAALATSGTYERSYKVGNQRVEHIFKGNLQAKSISVIAPTCLQSGIYATSLMINPCLQHNFKTIFIF